MKLALLATLLASAFACSAIGEWEPWTDCDCAQGAEQQRQRHTSGEDDCPHDAEIKTCDEKCDNESNAEAVASVGRLRDSIKAKEKTTEDHTAFDDIIALRNEIHQHYSEDAGEVHGLDEVITSMDGDELEKQRQQEDDERDEKREREDDQIDEKRRGEDKERTEENDEIARQRDVEDDKREHDRREEDEAIDQKREKEDEAHRQAGHTDQDDEDENNQEDGQGDEGKDTETIMKQMTGRTTHAGGDDEDEDHDESEDADEGDKDQDDELEPAYQRAGKLVSALRGLEKRIGDKHGGEGEGEAGGQWQGEGEEEGEAEGEGGEPMADEEHRLADKVRGELDGGDLESAADLEAQLADMLGGKAMTAGEKEEEEKSQAKTEGEQQEEAEQMEQVRIHVKGDKFSNSEAADAVWHRLYGGQRRPQERTHEQGQEEADVTVQVPVQPDSEQAHVETQRMLRGRPAAAAAVPAM